MTIIINCDFDPPPLLLKVVVDELTISTILGVLMVTVISLILMPHIAGFLFVS